MTEEQLVTLMDMVTDYYERFVVTETRFDAWWEILKDHDFEFCKNNLVKHARESSFVPTIADLLKGHRDMSRTYSDPLFNEKKMTPEEIIADIERRTGKKVKL